MCGRGKKKVLTHFCKGILHLYRYASISFVLDLQGRKVAGADFVGLEEMATISVMCNDSAIDYNEYKNAFEKVGEATETALIVLAEKINPYGVPKSGNRLDSAKAVRKDMEAKWKKDFTLEFSRDRYDKKCFPYYLTV